MRHLVAKSRQLVPAVRPSCLIFIHCVAHWRMRSREARGSEGGGVDVSSGGSSCGVTGGVSTAGGCGARCSGGRLGGAGARGARRAAACGGRSLADCG
ncbi:hypothetical protein [Methylosinus sp. PW1]|uniref:hypothetical protein n=1 Tax=Methylosinus sp. PW1 TaxID=107636 RepID=UPI0012EB0927|nr:hypothetical protein [Methylosinus sp. PW1]